MRTVKKAFNQADSVPLCSRCCGALLFRCLLSMQYTNTFKSIVCWQLKMKCLPETSLSWRKLPHPSYPRAIHTQWHTDQFSSVQSLSRVWLFATPWIAACWASLFITNSQSLFKLMSIKSVMPSSHLILCRLLLLLPPIPPSIRVFSNESTLHIRWPKYWSFSFSISPSNEHPGLISFRIGLVRTPCSPRDSQESSPTPQFKSINS